MRAECSGTDLRMPEFVTQVLTGSKQLFSNQRVFKQKPLVTLALFGRDAGSKAKFSRICLHDEIRIILNPAAGDFASSSGIPDG